MLMFNRKWRISFGTQGTDFRRLTGLRVVFDIKKTNDDNPNTAKIDIYNMSQKSRSIIEKPDTIIILEVGYGEAEYSVLFSGYINRVNHESKDADYITTVECGDGEIALRDVFISKSYSGGTNASSIINDIVKKMSTEGNVVFRKLPDFIDAIYEQGFVANGNSKDVLKDVLKKVNLSMSVQNNEIQITKRAEPTPNTAVLLTKRTGLIGSAKKMKEGKISFISLINPSIVPHRKVKIDSINVLGVFTTISVNHRGDTHGDDWFSTAECIDASKIDYTAFIGE